MQPARGQRKENYLVLVLSLSLVLGMTVAIAVYFAWTAHAILPGLDHPLTVLALMLCPPFILSVIVAPAPDSALALVLVVGTIVFANAFLYAGAGAALYFVVSLLFARKQQNS
jgi:hypothetical protein